MPIYEYRCLNCGVDFEELTSSSEETPDCPVCQSGDVAKKLSSFASGGWGGSGGEYGGGHTCKPGPFS